MGVGRTLLFIRHGETDYNRRHVRCGGDIDIPLTERGEAQARKAAAGLRAEAAPIDVLFVSPLLRTRRTAEIIRDELGLSCPLILHPGLIERRLGAWNGLDITASQYLLDTGIEPPEGEVEAVFRARVAQAVDEILAYAADYPLLVSSKGVARVLGLLRPGGPARPAGNAEVMRFDFPADWQPG